MGTDFGTRSPPMETSILRHMGNYN